MYVLVKTESPIKYVREICSDGMMPLTHRLSQAFAFNEIPDLIQALRGANRVTEDIQNRLTIRRVTQSTRWLDDGPVR